MHLKVAAVGIDDAELEHGIAGYRAEVWESFVLGANDKRISVELPLLHP